MRIILLALIFTQILSVAEIPTLRFDNQITWKQIFDNEFRLKHLEGLESHKCVSHNQELLLQFRDRETKFKFDKGSSDYGFFYDDFLQMVWYQGAEPITLEEGKRRSDEFKKVFDGYIIQELTIPRLIDPNGLVDAGNDENNVKVRVGEYLIWYEYDNSMRKDKPIIPHFYITWNFPGRPDLRLKDARDVVRTPKGHEWYSLDPKVNTPDPSLKVETPHLNSDDGVSPDSTDNSSIKKASEKSKPLNKNQRWVWIIGLGIFVLVIMGSFSEVVSKVENFNCTHGCPVKLNSDHQILLLSLRDRPEWHGSSVAFWVEGAHKVKGACQKDSVPFC